MALGAYPQISLTDARAARDEARKKLTKDIEPMAECNATKQARQLSDGNSFASIARLWRGNWKGSRSPRHAAHVMRKLEADIFPALGTRPIDQIEAPELVKMAKAMVWAVPFASGAPVCCTCALFALLAGSVSG